MAMIVRGDDPILVCKVVSEAPYKSQTTWQKMEIGIRISRQENSQKWNALRNMSLPDHGHLLGISIEESSQEENKNLHL